MIRMYLVTLTLYLRLKNGIAFLNQTEEMITLGLMKNLEIRHWILVTDADANLSNLNRLKVLVSWKIPMTYQSTSQSYQYFQTDLAPYVNTLIVFKVPNLGILIKFLNYLLEIQESNLMTKFKWLIFVDRKPSESEESQLEVRYDCFLVIVVSDGLRNLELMEIYKVKHRTFKFRYGVWDNDKGLLATNLSQYFRRLDLNESELIMEYLGSNETCASKRQCTHLEILDNFARRMNFKFRWVERPPENYNFLPGSDVLNVPCAYSSQFHIDEVDYFAPLFKIKVNWYIKRPTFREHDNYYMLPFDEELWATLLLWLIISITINTSMYWFWSHFSKSNDRLLFIDSAFMPFENICNQDGCPRKRAFPFRITCLVFCLFALFIIPSYSGNIISFIAARKPTVPFTSLKGFVKNGKYSFGAVEGGFPDQFFQSSSNPIIKLIHKNFYEAIEEREITKKICYRSFAFSAVDNDIYNFEPKCSIYQIKDPIAFVFTGQRLQKHSPFTKTFQHNFIQYYSSGVQEKMQKMLTDDRVKFIKKRSYRRATIDQMFQIFMLIPIGISIAYSILLLEIIIRWIRSPFCHRRRRKSLQKLKERLKKFERINSQSFLVYFNKKS